MNQIYLLYSCNEWKEKSSMRLVMATTILETLEGAIAKEIEDGNMNFAGHKRKKGVKAFRSGDFGYASLEYGYVDIVGDGEWQ